MKTVVKLISLVLTLMILTVGVTFSEGISIPPILESDLDFYTEAQLTNIDRLQEQVAAYEAELDMPELPDVDLYVFEKNGFDSLESYARAEAAMFGAILQQFTLDGQPAWGYSSAELYDNQWYIVRNDLFELPDGRIEEICWYSRTEGYAIADSGITIHLPLLYAEGAASPDLGICRSFISDVNLLNTTAVNGDPEEIDFIQMDLSESLGLDDLVIDYSTRLDALTELVTINGRCWYKIAGWVTAIEDNVSRYSVLYLQEKNDEVIGLNFIFPAESNGADLAIMATTCF